MVRDAASLTAALARAKPGVTITLEAGNYRSEDVRDGGAADPGRFVATAAGTDEAPITLQGPREAVLDGGGTGGGYGLHLVGARYWQLEGFTVSTASKGIVLDRSDHVRIDGVRVTDIGAEGVHFRSFSSDNVLVNSEIDHTGIRKPNFGEGVYIGSAVSNWGSYSDSAPDASDRNQVLDNRISATGAENIDIKEGSSSGTVRGNILDGSAIAGKNSADSWIDVKGNGYTIENNRGTQSLLDGFQVHVQAPGWGRDNTFAGNILDVRAPGVGIWLQNTAVDRGNVIRCSNVVTAAAAGDYATNHYTPLPCVP
ncbi:MAG: right-handed parallel beta-helix repeat-containing protein [Propionibacteriaceae bacterium]